jgi:hypothetical protein
MSVTPLRRITVLTILALDTASRCIHLEPASSPSAKAKGGAIKGSIVTLVVLFCLCTVTTAQVSPYQPKVSVLGNSIALFEAGLQAQIVPQLIPANVYIFGHKSYTCAMVRQVILFDAFGTQQAPRNPDVIVLANDTDNDVSRGTTPADLLTCLEGTVDDLLGRKSSLKIVVLTTPPQTDDCNGCLPCLVDQNKGLIQQYNDITPTLQQYRPHNVRVLDAHTPFCTADDQGPTCYADHAKMTYGCGIHPGDPGVWDGGQPTLAGVYRKAVMTSNQPW